MFSPRAEPLVEEYGGGRLPVFDRTGGPIRPLLGLSLSVKLSCIL